MASAISSDAATPLDEIEFLEATPNKLEKQVSLLDVLAHDGGGFDDYHGHLRRSMLTSEDALRRDARDMRRMGKKQELQRSIRVFSTMAFTVLVQSTWEIMLLSSSQGLEDGGRAGMFWSYIWTTGGLFFVMLSLAEMASMAPTSGGQYHWVSEFAPPNYQKGLSFINGWLSTLSWQAGTATGPFLVGGLLEAMITSNCAAFTMTSWESTLLIIAITLCIFVFNAFAIRYIPVFQNLMFIFHVFTFFTILVCFWILAPRVPATDVFITFSNSGGWSSAGLAVMVGQISAIFTLTGSDAAAHLSEEIRDAAVAVPKAMMRSYVVNASIGVVFLIAYLFVLTDLDAALNDPTGYPHIWVFRNAFGLATMNVLNALTLVLLVAGSMSFNLSTTRQTWAFARDGGLPCGPWIAQVNKTYQSPISSCMLTAAITIALSLINIGSSVAFGAIVSLNVVALMTSYTISTGCVLFRRICHPELLPEAQWSLGRYGILVNGVAFMYSIFACFWCFWPSAVSPNPTDFNWAVLVFSAVLLASAVDFVLRARKVYTGPVVLVEGWKDH